MLRIIGLNRSTYYYRIGRLSKSLEPRGGRPVPGWSWTKDGRRVDDDKIRKFLYAHINGDGEFYGYLKLTHALRQDNGLIINKKKVYRLCKEMAILRPQRKLNPSAQPRKLARNRLITGSNQLWATDIKYGYILGEDRFFYVASIIDVFDRCILAAHVGLRCQAKDILRTLNTALKNRGLVKPGLVLRSDNGPQFKSKLMAKECPKLGVMQEFIPFKTPNMNAHIESYHSILEAECMSQHNFETFGDGYRTVMDFVRKYNTRRLHSGCKYLPPEVYYRAIRSKTAIVTAIAV